MVLTRRSLIATAVPGAAAAQSGRSQAAQAADHRACLFGDAAQSHTAPAGATAAVWSGVRQGGEDGTVRIVYRIAEPLRGGVQPIEFGLLNLSDTPVQVHFIVVVTSDIGRWYRYHFTVAHVAALGEASGGEELSRAPFPPGECIADVAVSDIRSEPAGP
jgi:hypothetical protein